MLPSSYACLRNRKSLLQDIWWETGPGWSFFLLSSKYSFTMIIGDCEKPKNEKRNVCSRIPCVSLNWLANDYIDRSKCQGLSEMQPRLMNHQAAASGIENMSTITHLFKKKDLYFFPHLVNELFSGRDMFNFHWHVRKSTIGQGFRRHRPQPAHLYHMYLYGHKWMACQGCVGSFSRKYRNW